MNSRLFVKLCLITTCMILAVVALINAIVDPYELYGLVSRGGFNQRKTQAVDQARLVKPYLVARSHPTTLLLGSSRVEVGFNPDSALWPEAMRPVFNLGMPATGPRLQLMLLQHALAVTNPRHVVLGIGFEDAHIPPSHTGPPNAAAVQPIPDLEGRLRRPDWGAGRTRYWLAHAKDTVLSLASLNALTDSILTVLNQRDPYASSLTPLGFNTASGFTKLTRTDGAYHLIVDKDRIKAAEIVQWSMEPRLDVEPLAEAIRVAHLHGAAVTVVIAPVHIDELEIYSQAGVLSRYDEWRRRVLEIVEAGSRTGIATLWDFTAPAPFTTESPPASTDRVTELRWFWESNHFKAALGDLVIARIFGTGSAEFGTPVTPANLAAEEARQHKLLDGYADTHPDDVRRVAVLVAAEFRRICEERKDACQGTQVAHASGAQ
jgi:hypothetical protein